MSKKKQRRPKAKFKPCKVCKTPRPAIFRGSEIRCRGCGHTWIPKLYELSFEWTIKF